MTALLLLYGEMFVRFFLVGLFAVGGGLATLPFLVDMGEVTGWFTQLDISNMVAISESTPGPLGINMATYIGFQISKDYGAFAGILGAIIAPLGVVTPSVIIVITVSKILDRFKDSKYVQYAFYGLRAASFGLIVSALLSVAKIAFLGTESTFSPESINWLCIVLSVIIFTVTMKFKKVHPILLIVFAAIMGIIFKM